MNRIVSEKLPKVISQAIRELDSLSANSTSQLERVLSNTVSQLDGMLSNAENRLGGVLLDAIISGYLLVFLAGLVMYALVSKAMGKSIDSVWFYACFLFLNIWISIRVRYYVVIFFGILFMLFLYLERVSMIGWLRGWRIIRDK